jgi:hypothetical protein
MAHEADDAADPMRLEFFEERPIAGLTHGASMHPGAPDGRVILPSRSARLTAPGPLPVKGALRPTPAGG